MIERSSKIKGKMARINLKHKKENRRAKLIRKYRTDGETMESIGKKLKMTRQGVYWYIKKYNLDEGLEVIK